MSASQTDQTGKTHTTSNEPVTLSDTVVMLTLLFSTDLSKYPTAESRLMENIILYDNIRE